MKIKILKQYPGPDENTCTLVSRKLEKRHPTHIALEYVKPLKREPRNSLYQPLPGTYEKLFLSRTLREN